jgi:hypothetical protein
MKEKFMEICRAKATAAKKDLSDEDLNFLETIGEGVESAFTAETASRNAQLDELAKRVGVIDEGKTFSEIIRNLGTKIDEVEAKSKRTLTGDEKYQLKRMLTEKKDEIAAARKSGANWAIEFKAKRGASALMTTATVLTGASAINTVSVLDDLEVLVIQYPKNFIIDAIGGRQVSKVPAVERWKEQNAESVDATGTAVSEGAAKQLTDKSFVWKTANRKKYAGRIEFTEELQMDFDQLLLQIITMFEQQVIRSWNAGVLADVVAYCSAYQATELDGTFVSPGTSQVIQAGKLCIENNLYEPDLVFIRPGDYEMARIAQNANGDITYIPDAVAFHGLTPIVNKNVPVGTIIIGSSMTIQEQHSNFIIRNGQYGNQLIENEYTIIGEVFSLLKLPTISQKSWVSLNIDTVKQALTKVTQ